MAFPIPEFNWQVEDAEEAARLEFFTGKAEVKKRGHWMSMGDMVKRKQRNALNRDDMVSHVELYYSLQG